MVEASPGGSSLSVTIDKSLLECSICCGPFDDPRSLPCLHPFCCGCLETWAKTCSNNKKTLNCPLCKKVYRIPTAEGIKGFPAHFIVTDLQSSVERANQKSFVCEEHGEKKIYYCETCGCAACSDCTALDPAHRGHTFIRLKQAAEQQRRSLENLVTKVQNVEQNCVRLIELAKQMKLDLNIVTKEKKKAIDEARDEHLQQRIEGDKNYMQQVNEIVIDYRREVSNKRKVQAETIKQIENKLCSDLALIRNSCELATNEVESKSDIDVISIFPSLSSALEQHTRYQVSAIDSSLSQIQIEPPRCTTADLALLEQLLCDKLHIQVPLSSKIQARNRTCHPPPKPVEVAKNNSPSSSGLPPSSLSSNSSETIATSPAGNTATESRDGIPKGSSWFRQFPWFWFTLTSFAWVWSPFSWLSWFLSAFSMFVWIGNALSVQLETRRWKLHEVISIAPNVKHPRGIVVNPNGDFAVVNNGAPVTVFCRNGQFKFSLKGSPSGVNCIAVTPNNHYIIPMCHGKKFYVYIYDSHGNLLNASPKLEIFIKPCKPSSITVDSTGRIIVGVGNKHYNKTMYIFQSDGTPISQFETQAHPLCVTCAPDDRLIISFDDGTLQVMDQSGRNASIISGVLRQPLYVCCSKQGELFVTTCGKYHGLFRFVSKGGKFKYEDRMMSTDIVFNRSPWNEQLMGIAFSADEEELFVVSKRATWPESSYVKIFRYQ